MTGTRTMMHGEAKAALLTHSLSRRGQLHLETADKLLFWLYDNVDKWAQDHKQSLGQLVEAYAKTHLCHRDSKWIALRCLYVEVADEPTLGQRMPEMVDILERWEMRQWRERGHVALVIERAKASCEKEMVRRAQAKHVAANNESKRKRQARALERSQKRKQIPWA